MSLALSTAITLIAVIAGMAVTAQSGMNGTLGRTLGHPLWATLVSLSVSIAVILPLLMVLRISPPTMLAMSKVPTWAWIGGACGAFYVTAALVLAPKIGASSFVVAVVAGQLIASVVLDHYGVAGFAARPATTSRLLGVAVVIVGVAVMQLGSAAVAGVKPAVIKVGVAQESKR